MKIIQDICPESQFSPPDIVEGLFQEEEEFDIKKPDWIKTKNGFEFQLTGSFELRSELNEYTRVGRLSIKTFSISDSKTRVTGKSFWSEILELYFVRVWDGLQVTYQSEIVEQFKSKSVEDILTPRDYRMIELRKDYSWQEVAVELIADGYPEATEKTLRNRWSTLSKRAKEQGFEGDLSHLIRGTS